MQNILSLLSKGILRDKVILVTGSTTGIGEGIARACIDQGAKVMLHGRDEARAEELQQELGKNAKYHICDLEDVEELEELIAKTVATFGRLDGLVNNAGIYPRNTIDTLDNEFFDKVVAVNMKAPLFLSKYAVNVFRTQQKRGVIVNIGSINAYCGQRDLLVYSMTKGALMTMTRNLADALGQERIRVYCLNVGWTVTETEIALKQREGFPADWEKKVPKLFAPSGRLQRPEHIAPHVVFWLSDASYPSNGCVYDLEQYPMIGRNLITEIKMEEE